MKRIAILLAVVAMFASTATIAFADDDATTEVETESTEERELNETQLAKAELLAKFLLYDYSEDGAPGDADEPTETELAEEAEELEMTTEAIAALRTGDTAVGWGAIFKLIQLYKLAQADDPESTLTFEMMLKSFEDEGWGFGKRFKEYRNDSRKDRDGTPKNFGQLKKLEREANASQDD